MCYVILLTLCYNMLYYSINTELQCAIRYVNLLTLSFNVLSYSVNTKLQSATFILLTLSYNVLYAMLFY